MIKKIIFFLIFSFAFIQSFADVLQDQINPLIGTETKSAITATDLDGVTVFAKNTIFGLLGLIAIGVFLFIGARLFISRGNPEEFSKATQQLIYAVVGLFVVTIAYAAVRLVAGLNIN